MVEKLRERVTAVIEKRQLCGYMNDTKWRELRNAMYDEMPFPPPFILKTIFEEECPEEQYFQNDVTWWGDWDEGFLYENYLDMWSVAEWIKVRPRYLKARGRLIEPELIDAARQFEEILTKYHIPYEEKDGVYCIYGYR